jgi:hypothetical protein
VFDPRQDTVPLSLHQSGSGASTLRTRRQRGTRPAAESLTAAGRTVPPDGGALAEQGEESLVEEVERLRKRVRQQEEALTRLAAALKALRRAGQALHEENRELRLALQRSRTEAGEARFL